ncbi:MAG: sulfotransferase, partial [Xenococcaceae cyanobacterium MO_188.B19]|nr:sulfotransferase [Xenococcaceae cyanobacterium MO_188.B19]
QQLQLLSWKWSEKRWLLKAPFHLFYLSSLITVFPDAHIIWNHRSPQKVLPSLCSLSASVRSIYTEHLNLKALGEQYLNILTKGMEKSIEMRQTIPKSQIYDLNYLDLVSDPIDRVQKIYGYFGYEFTQL